MLNCLRVYVILSIVVVSSTGKNFEMLSKVHAIIDCQAFDCMVENFEVFDLSDVSTLNATSDCQLFGIQELVRLLAEHPVWTDFNESSELYRIQVCISSTNESSLENEICIGLSA